MERRVRRPGERPRLLIVTPDFPPARGGIQLVMERVAEGLEGLERHVITLDSPDAADYDGASALPVRRVAAGGWSQRGRVAALNAAAIEHARRLRPAITLSGHVVVSPAAAAIRRALGARTCQYFYAEEVGARPSLAAFAVRNADVSIAISAYTAGLVAGTGAESKDMKLIPPGVDIPGDATPLPCDRPTVLTIARLQERYKGHEVMVRAFALVLAKVPDAHWVVIGDGSLRPGIEHMARAYGIAESVRFLGAVSDGERDAWLRRARLLAMPSRLPPGGFAGEGFGIAFLEAGTYGKPVVAGAVGGALDAVVDGETGLLVDPTDPLAVADAISSLLLDPALAERLGSAGRRRAQSFCWPAIVRRVEAALLEALAPPGVAA